MHAPNWLKARAKALAFGAMFLAACQAPAPVERPLEPFRTPAPSLSSSPLRPATGSSELFAYSSLRGVLYDANSSPVPGLEVALESRESRRPYQRRIPVSAAGAYVFTQVPIMANLQISAHRVGEVQALRTRNLAPIRQANEYRVVHFGGPNSTEDPTASAFFIPPSPSPQPTPSPSPSPSPEASASPTPTPFLG